MIGRLHRLAILVLSFIAISVSADAAPPQRDPAPYDLMIRCDYWNEPTEPRVQPNFDTTGLEAISPGGQPVASVAPVDPTRINGFGCWATAGALPNPTAFTAAPPRVEFDLSSHSFVFSHPDYTLRLGIWYGGSVPGVSAGGQPYRITFSLENDLAESVIETELLLEVSFPSRLAYTKPQTLEAWYGNVSNAIVALPGTAFALERCDVLVAQALAGSQLPLPIREEIFDLFQVASAFRASTRGARSLPIRVRSFSGESLTVQVTGNASADMRVRGSDVAILCLDTTCSVRVN